MATGQDLNLNGYKLTFDDEFNSFSSNGPSNYLLKGHTGTWDTTISYGERKLNDETELYSDPTIGVNPDSASNGVLNIQAAPSKDPTKTWGQTYTSGVITTYHSFSQEYGYFEMRAELPQGSGMWPAFWMLPLQHVWPPELDPLEAFGQTNTNADGGAYTFHHGLITSDPNAQGGWVGTNGANLYTQYNRFGVDWEPNTITFYFNGVAYASEPTPSDFHQPMYLLANLAVGGNWAGAPVGETANLKIDYIRAYSNDGSNPAVVQQQVSSPDGRGYDFYGAIDANGNGALGGSDLAPLPSTATIVIGSGNDTLALSVSEDALQDNAQFTVSVDGNEIGGTQTATASHGAGQTQAVDVMGSFAPGSHQVSIDFLNPAVGGARSFYIDGATIDGAVVSGGLLSLSSKGPQAFLFNGTTSAPVTLGSGPDALILAVSDDPWNGDAQFAVIVDGIQIGGTQTATASRALGASQSFVVLGSFSAGQHNVSVKYLNDVWGGSPNTDRNLYVDSASINGVAVPNGSLTLLLGGTQSLPFTVPLPPSVPVSIIPTAPTGLALASGSDSGVQGDGITNVTRPVINGSGEAGAVIIVTDMRGGVDMVLGTTVTDSGGDWSFTPATALADGVHNLTTSAADGTLSASSAPLSLTIDTVAPAATSIVETGAIGLTGIAEPGSIIAFHDGSTAVGSVAAAANGAWAFLPSTLPAGSYALTASVGDAAGNISAGSAALAVTVAADRSFSISTGEANGNLVTRSYDAGGTWTSTDTAANGRLLQSVTPFATTRDIHDGTGTLIGTVTEAGSATGSAPAGFQTSSQAGGATTTTDSSGSHLDLVSGNQVVFSRGSDTISSAAGYDTINADTRPVSVTGGAGEITFHGGSGFSTVNGGSGTMTAFGGSGGGIFDGGSAGGSVLVAGSGNATLTGGGDGDRLFGSATGQVAMVAAHGRESLVGGGGSTSMTGGATAGSVIFTGGSTTVTGGAAGGDTVIGGAGSLTMSMHSDAVFAGSGATFVTGGTSGADSIIIGGSGGLSVTGHGDNMIVVGGDGPSAISIGNGASVVFAGAGTMNLDEGAGAGSVVLGRGNTRIAEGKGAMTYDLVKGTAGGTDVIGGYRPGTDRIALFGYGAETATIQSSGGGSVLSLSDGTHVPCLECSIRGSS